MGSGSSIDCCQPQVSSYELKSIVPSKIYAVAVVQESFAAIKECVGKISFLSELDYYIGKIKESQAYRNRFLQLFPSLDDFLQTGNYNPNPQWILPIQTKTYDTAQPRFNQVTRTTFPMEMGIIDSNPLNTQLLITKGNLKKAASLLLDRQFTTYKEEEYLKLLIKSLKEWEGLQDFVWILDPQQTFENMKHHLIYHWNRFNGYINSDLSLNDALSWDRARYIYNFFLHRVTNQPPMLLETTYYLDNWLYEAEALLLAPGEIIVFFGFPEFSPYYEQNIDDEDDLVRLSPPKGEEDVPKCKIKVIVQPSKETGSKFRCNQQLFYLPLTMFLVTNIESKYGQLFVYLKENPTQNINDYLSKNKMQQIIKKKSSKQLQDKMINEMSVYRDQIASQIEQQVQKIKNDESCMSYYKNYVKNRITILKQQDKPVFSKKEMEIYEEDVQIKLDEQPTLQEVQSEPIWVPITEQQAAPLERELQKYIKRLDFQKLQTQIDNSDRFINITTLNISQCWLERLQCLHCFPNLLQLFAYSNLISKIEGLDRNPNLRLLSLARNQIEVLENMNHLIHLRELYLTKNKLELQSAVYISNLNLSKLKLLTISFKQQADECFDAFVKRPPPRLKQLLINEGDQLSNRTKSTLHRRLKGVDIQYIHG